MIKDNFFVDLTKGTEVKTLNEFSQQQNTQRQKLEDIISRKSNQTRERFKEGILATFNDLKKQNQGKEKDEMIDQMGKDKSQKYKFKPSTEEVKPAGKQDTINSEQGKALEKIGFAQGIEFNLKSKLREKCSRFL
jgi:hypothetical protein